jgi:hypothetical protein
MPRLSAVGISGLQAGEDVNIYTCPYCGQRFSQHELALYEGECPNLECPGPQAKGDPAGHELTA